MKLTTKQEESLNKLKQRWKHVSEPYPFIGDDCAMVDVGNNDGIIDMTIGIEAKDGHCHT